jgi:hypothetical protein
MKPYFASIENDQHYALSYVEMIAYFHIKYNKNWGDLRSKHKDVLFRQDEWQASYKSKSLSTKSPKWSKLVSLHKAVTQGQITSLDDFYIKFKEIKIDRRGKALEAQKYTKAKIKGAKESFGDDFIDNNKLFSEVHKLAERLVHSRHNEDAIKVELNELTSSLHTEALSDKQQKLLFNKLIERKSAIEAHINLIDTTLLDLNSKVSSRALFFYGIIKRSCLIGDTICKSYEQWATLSPFGKNNVKEAMKLLVSLEAIEVIEKGLKGTAKGKAYVYKRLV